MEATPGSEMDAVQKIRELLLANVYGNRATDRVVKKQAVRQLLAPIMAARDVGMTFDDISRLFTQGGLTLDPETLRKYFGEAKLASQLAEDARRHADQVAKAKNLIERRRAADAFEQADRAARESVAAMADVEHAAPAVTSPARRAGAGQSAVLDGAELSRQVDNGGPPPSPVSRPPVVGGEASSRPPAAVAVRSLGRGPGAQRAPTAKSGPVPQPQPQPQRAAMPARGARTIDDVERESAGVDQRHVLLKDIEVRDGKVYTSDGVPYGGMLNRKQLHLLKQVGKLMAPVQGESSKAFVVMPECL